MSKFPFFRSDELALQARVDKDPATKTLQRICDHLYAISPTPGPIMVIVLKSR